MTSYEGGFLILHVGNPSVFMGPLQKLVKSEFSQEKHRFWLSPKKYDYEIDEGPGVYVSKKGVWGGCKAYCKLVFELHLAQKVILHGLFNPRLVLLLSLMPWLTPKCYWVIWGGDLYQYKKTNLGIKAKFLELVRAFVIRRIGHLVTYIEGDVDLARQWYGAKGTYHECIMYLSNVVNPGMLPEASPQPDKAGLNILLGNSADPSNNHIEALERLLPYKDQDIRIYAPLSYGDQDNAKKVIVQGKEWFGDKFVPMTDFMPFERYLQFLESLDIAIFNHQRQQAMGNTITLLGGGKTVYLRSDVSQWEFFKKEGITVLDVEGSDLKLLDFETAAHNTQLVNQKFSREKLIEQYAKIFAS